MLQGIIKEATKKLYLQALITGISRDDDMDEFQSPAVMAIYPVYFATEELPFPVMEISDTMPYLSTKYKGLTPSMYLLWRQAFVKAIKNALDNFKPDLVISHHLWLSSALAKELASEILVICISHATDLKQLELAPQFTDEVIAGFGQIERMVIIEALASGLRVVVSDLPGLRLWLGDEINHSGLISYVSLPGLVKASQPITEELPIFKFRIKNSLLIQRKKGS